MNKSELLAAIAAKSGQKQTVCNEVLNALDEVIVEEVRDGGDTIRINSGTFKQKINAARKGINPLTGKPMEVKESHTIAFKVSSGMKKVIEDKPVKKGKK